MIEPFGVAFWIIVGTFQLCLMGIVYLRIYVPHKKNMDDRLRNDATSAVFYSMCQAIMRGATNSDMPREDLITSLNICVDTCNEGLVGKSAEQYKVPYFKLVNDVPLMTEEGEDDG